MGQQQSQEENAQEPATPVGRYSASAPASPRSPTEEIGEDLHELNGRLSSFLHDIGTLESSRVLLENELHRERALAADQIRELRDRAEREADSMRKYCEQLQQQARDAKEQAKRDAAQLEARLDAAHRAHVEELARVRDEYERRLNDELASLRAQQDDQVLRTQARLTAELASARQKLEQLQDEHDKLKRADRHDPELAAQLARVRRENADLQRQLSAAEEKFAERQQAMSSLLKDKAADLQRTKDCLIDKELQLATVTEAHAAILKEVNMYRSLLDREIDRITPSKSKKRKLGTSPPPTPSFEAETPMHVEEPSTPSKQTPYSSRRSSMKQTIESASEFLDRDTVKITAVDSVSEFVTITNTTDDAIDIGSWRIHAEKGKKDFKFPPGFSLTAQGSVTVYSGKDNESRALDDNELWWTAKPVWGVKGGDTAVLFNENDRKIAKLAAI